MGLLDFIYFIAFWLKKNIIYFILNLFIFSIFKNYSFIMYLLSAFLLFKFFNLPYEF